MSTNAPAQLRAVSELSEHVETGRQPSGAELKLPGSVFRFATAGSVDDGKSTLVGRLLHDSKAILADTLAAVAQTSAERGFGGDAGGLDLALLTDGLRAEREQGITIDVAYRYFASDRRSFILADCPGHVQYTKNTVTGASTADAVVVLIDARKGVLEQTRRHLSVLRLLRVPHVIVAVNKVDLVDYSQEVFEAILADIEAVAHSLGIITPTVIPVSALAGDNVVERSERTPWYNGPTLITVLEELPRADDADEAEGGAGLPLRLPIQHVSRPQGALAPGVDAEEFRDYRGYAGQIVTGEIAVGDDVELTPSGQRTVVTAIDGPGGVAWLRARAPQSVIVRFGHDVDASRGESIVAAGSAPQATQDLRASLAWLGEKELREGAVVLVKHGTRTVRGVVRAITGTLDLASFELKPSSALTLNDIGTVQLRLASALPLESYRENRKTGSFLLIDPLDGQTLAAGMVSAELPDEAEQLFAI